MHFITNVLSRQLHAHLKIDQDVIIEWVFCVACLTLILLPLHRSFQTASSSSGGDYHIFRFNRAICSNTTGQATAS